MASKEHKNLSDYIKLVHKQLRDEAIVLGAKQAWEKHCKNEETLEKYSKAMQELAVNHWDKNSQMHSKAASRVTWVHNACKDYFADIDKYRNKELEIWQQHINKCGSEVMKEPGDILEVDLNTKVKVLDVGSCYNPLKIFELFDVTPIDIAPANTDVLKCDFLDVKVSDRFLIEGTNLSELPEGYFHVVFFSLLLEYLPSPELRLKCCLKAYKLLRKEGIMIIITPDSNHVGANAKIIKSWRHVLAKIGFTRIKYEKLHYIHCMVFRKAGYKEVAQRWADIHVSKGLFDKIHIPQDFNKDKSIDDQLRMHYGEDSKWCTETFLNDFYWNASII